LVREFNEVYRLFQGNRSKDRKVRLIAGNHDYVSGASRESSLVGLSKVVDFVYWRETCSEGFRCSNGIAKVCFVPWEGEIPAPAQIEEIWGSERYRSGPNILVGHVAVEGAIVGSREYQPPAGTPLTMFDHFDLVLLGHYHKRQSVTSKVHYVGSLVAHDFGDAGEVRGFTKLNLDTLETEFIPLATPRFLIVRDGDKRLTDYEEKEISGNYVRVDSREPCEDEDAVRAMFESRGALGVVFNYEREYSDQARLSITVDTPLQDTLRQYVEREKASLDAERLLRVAEETMEEKEC